MPSKERPRARLVLADDHRMVVEALRTSLGHDHTIVGIAVCARALLQILREFEADCLLLDLDMPDRNGLQLIPMLRKKYPAMRILVLTMHADRVLAEAAIAAGADGFVPKDANLAELATAIKEVCAGRRHLSPRIPKASHRLGLGAEHAALQQLTRRQQQIVLLLGECRSATEIGRLLDVGPSTITFHKQNIMRVLGMASDGALLQYAVLLRTAIAASR